MSLSLLDFVVMAGVFLLTLSAVFYGRRKLRLRGVQKESTSELLLMGRTITLPLFVASLVSSWYGGLTGVTALTYETGLFNFLTQGVFWYVAYLIFALILVRRIPKNGAQTFPELIGRHIGPRARWVSGVLNVVNLLPIACVLNLAILIKFITGWSLLTAAALGVSLVLTYSLSGGLRSVVYAEFVQFLAMSAAVLMVVLFGFMKHGGPLELIDLLPASHLSPTGGQPLSEIFIWGFIALATLADPLFYQRALAARSQKQAIVGILVATLIWFCFDCCTTLGGLYARAYFPNVDPNESYFLFAFSVLPAGLKGLFVAGICSAALASLDTNLFSSSSILSFDFLQKTKLEKRNLQLTMLAVAIASWAVLPLFQGSVAQVWKIMGSVSSSCLLFPWLVTLLVPVWRNEQSFIASVGTGILSMVIGGVMVFSQITAIDPFYFGLGGSILGFIVAHGIFLYTAQERRLHSA